MAKKVILVTGASGNIGKASLTSLEAYKESLSVKAGVRDPTKSSAVALLETAPSTSLVVADPLSTDFPSSLAGVDYLYIVTPGAHNRTEIALAAIKAAKSAGIKFVLIISVFTTSLEDTLFGEQFTPVEKSLKESGLNFTILQLPFFIENNFGSLQTIKDQGAIYGPVDPEKPLTAVSVNDVGEVAAKILSDPTPHFGKTYKLSSALFTYNQLAKAFSEALGKPVNYVQVTYEAAKQALLDFGFLDWQILGIEQLNKAIDSGNPVYVDENAVSTIESIIGRPGVTIEDWTKAVAPAFK